MRLRPVWAAAALTLAVALVGCSAPAKGTPGHRSTVVVTVHWSRFSTARLDVAPGTTVRFVVRNTDPVDHELIVGDQAVQDVHELGTEAHHGDRPGEVSVPAGTTASTTYRFDRPGTVLFGCHLPGHWAYGMHGTVTVA
jgi:uncharacterized cupredoxin-like copper-binding protein